MELFNATGETLSHGYDNQMYTFPTNEIVRVTDDCGHHLMQKLAWRGLQEISFGDDPDELARVALNAIIRYHEHQIDVHETQVRVAGESKNPVPAEPEGYKTAKRRLPTYMKVLEERKAGDEAAAVAKEEKAIRESLSKQTDEIRSLDDMDVDELRVVVRSLGEEPDMRVGSVKLIQKIEALRETEK
jgi:hypothetical protein